MDTYDDSFFGAPENWLDEFLLNNPPTTPPAASTADLPFEPNFFPPAEPSSAEAPRFPRGRPPFQYVSLQDIENSPPPKSTDAGCQTNDLIYFDEEQSTSFCTEYILQNQDYLTDFLKNNPMMFIEALKGNPWLVSGNIRDSDKAFVGCVVIPPITSNVLSPAPEVVGSPPPPSRASSLAPEISSQVVEISSAESEQENDHEVDNNSDNEPEVDPEIDSEDDFEDDHEPKSDSESEQEVGQATTSSASPPSDALRPYPASPSEIQASRQEPASGRQWRLFEQDHAIGHMLNIRDENILTGETRFAEVSRRLKSQDSIDRTATAVKNFWNRIGRARSGFDERKNKNAPLSTSHQVKTKKNGKGVSNASQSQTSKSKKGKSRAIDSDSDDESDSDSKQSGSVTYANDYKGKGRAADSTRKRKRYILDTSSDEGDDDYEEEDDYPPKRKKTTASTVQDDENDEPTASSTRKRKRLVLDSDDEGYVPALTTAKPNPPQPTPPEAPAIKQPRKELDSDIRQYFKNQQAVRDALQSMPRPQTSTKYVSTGTQHDADSLRPPITGKGASSKYPAVMKKPSSSSQTSRPASYSGKHLPGQRQPASQMPSSSSSQRRSPPRSADNDTRNDAELARALANGTRPKKRRIS